MHEAVAVAGGTLPPCGFRGYCYQATQRGCPSAPRLAFHQLAFLFLLFTLIL